MRLFTFFAFKAGKNFLYYNLFYYASLKDKSSGLFSHLEAEKAACYQSRVLPSLCDVTYNLQSGVSPSPERKRMAVASHFPGDTARRQQGFCAAGIYKFPE